MRLILRTRLDFFLAPAELDKTCTDASLPSKSRDSDRLDAIFKGSPHSAAAIASLRSFLQRAMIEWYSTLNIGARRWQRHRLLRNNNAGKASACLIAT
jgi:hypothetical protein